MSRLKRQRLTVDGAESVTAVGNDGTGEAEHAPHEIGQIANGKREQQRSLFVRSLPDSTTTQSLTALFSETYPLKHAIVVLDPITKQSKGYGFVTFADVEDAQKAKVAFDGNLIDGKRIKVELAKPRARQAHSPKNTDYAGASTADHPADGKQQSSRLIVRNLPWTIKDADQLSLLFRSFGKVKQASVPKRGPGLSSGFGFVLLRGHKNAEKAMKALNGKEIEGRVVAVDWAVDKDTWVSLQPKAQKPEDEDEPQSGGSKADGEESVKSEDGSGIAIDPVSRSNVEYIGQTRDQKNGDVEWSEDDEDNEDGDEDEYRVDEEHEEESIVDADEDEEDEDHKDDKSSTLFVRNLPFTATEESLATQFKHFGGVRYARIVLDKATERSKGVGFVCFYDEQDADTCIKSAPRMSSSTYQQAKGPGTISGKQSLLQDASIDRLGKYTMDGRVLQISRAVDRREAARLRLASSFLREARDKDKRRLYLLAEGSLPSNSPLYNQLSPTETKMREDSAKQRQSLIRTNPALHLSLTRLSVRNLPRTFDSKALKALAREAVVGFAKDVKAGLRKQLTREELSRGGIEMKKSEQARRTKGKGIVGQAKIIFEGREGTKVAEDSGAGRSRGYGFIEYSSHRWALMGLRWLNGHTVESSRDSMGLNRERKKRLIVEFAIENAQVVMRRKEKEAKARETSKLVQAKRGRGAFLVKKESRENGLMAKSKEGTKSKQDRSGGTTAAFGKIETKVGTGEHRLVKRQQIIGRKRMLRRNKTEKAE